MIFLLLIIILLFALLFTVHPGLTTVIHVIIFTFLLFIGVDIEEDITLQQKWSSTRKNSKE